MSIKVFIFGSCVSRDIFNFDAASEFVVADYYARSSLAALNGVPFEDNSALDRIESSFQRRMVSRDFSKDILSNNSISDADIILVDLIDERFNVLRLTGGACITASAELVSTGLPKSTEHTIIKSGSPDHREAWRTGLERLFQNFFKNGILDRVVINKVHWASAFDVDNGQEFPVAKAIVDAANEHLDWMYTELRRWLKPHQFMEPSAGYLVSSPSHKWGPSPFHYVDGYYREALNTLKGMHEVAKMANLDQKIGDVGQEKINLDDVLAVTMELIADDFQPFGNEAVYSEDSVELPLFTGEKITVSLASGIDWDAEFSTQANSSRMWLYSLATVGRLISTASKHGNSQAMLLAEAGLASFLDRSEDDGFLAATAKQPSADHAAATRVRVLIKYLQSFRMGLTRNIMLLSRAAAALLYWSDWLAAPKNFEANNHGLMGTMALLHASVQLAGSEQAGMYANIAEERIISLARESFDSDGLCNENSIGYHNFNLHCYKNILAFCRHYRVSESLISFLDDVMEKATNALRRCIWQDGSIPPLGDSAVYRVNVESINEPFFFSESGFAVVKSADLYFSLICGGRTEIHKQMDDSAISLRFKGVDILVDAGSYLYDRSDRFRRCVESTNGHSGLSLKEFDGLLRSEYLKKYGPVKGAITQFITKSTGVGMRCEYSSESAGFRCVRAVLVRWPDEVSIVDWVEFADKASDAKAVQRLLLGPSVAVSAKEGNAFEVKSADVDAYFFMSPAAAIDSYCGQDDEKVRGWCSYKLKEILPTHGIDQLGKADGTRLVTVIKLSPCHSLHDVSAETLNFIKGNHELFGGVESAIDGVPVP